MKPAVMAALATAGIFHKKNRILCCQDRDEVMATWLRRQRFKVETTSSETLLSMGKGADGLLFDVLIAALNQDELPASETLARQLRAGYGLLKPGGRCVLCCMSDELFMNAGGQDAKNALADLFSMEPVASIRQLPQNANLEADIVVVKKGGAYKPHLPVYLIREAEPFQKVCAALQKVDAIGLDVETTLAEPRILCTVQLATEDRVYLIDALPLKDLSPLKQLMEDESVLKIIHNKTFEEKMLGHYGIQIRKVYDTLIESRKRHKGKKDGGHKLGEVCERELGIYLDKSLQASDWTIRPLSQEQCDYAAADAEVLIRLHRLFVPPPVPENMELF